MSYKFNQSIFTMKKPFYLSLVAAMALTACSNDEPAKGSNDGNDFGYVAVNIVQPKSIGGRATSFEQGTEDENYAEKALFFIFDNTGNQVGDCQEIALTGDKTGGDNPAVERIYNAVLVIDGAASKPATNLQIVCVLNAPADMKGSKATLSALKGEIDDYATGRTEKGAFIMTNSAYKNESKDVLGAEITEANLAKSAAEALSNPVDIYVERVVAKVRAHADGSFTNNGANPTVDGTEVPLTIHVTGIEIANIATTSYLFKSISGIDWTWAWDTANKRSYWENVPSPLTYSNKSYTAIATDENFDIANASFSEYIQPNTSGQKTCILVTAELLKDGKPYEMVYMRGGYFAPGNALSLVAQYVANQGFWKKTGEDSYSQLGADDFEWYNNGDLPEDAPITWLKDYEVLPRVKESVTNIYVKDAEGNYTAANADDINGLFTTTERHPYVARYFTEGKCYYFVNIDQTPVAKDNGYTGEGKFEGVVRNHIYDLSLNSIAGVGTPIFDPEDVIIPQIPDDDELWYLSARVNVLQWKLVNQTIDFSGTK